MAEKIVEAISEESIEKIAGGLAIDKEKVLSIVKKIGIPVLTFGVGVTTGVVSTLGVQAHEGQGPWAGKGPWAKRGKAMQEPY